MRNAFTALVSIAALALAFRVLSACLAIVPVIVEKDVAVPADGSCLTCLERPETCSGLIEACNADVRCKPAYACIVREACFDLPTLDDKINCGLPCAQDAGIQSAADPVISTYLVGFVACAQEKCAVDCNLSDASLGL